MSNTFEPQRGQTTFRPPYFKLSTVLLALLLASPAAMTQNTDTEPRARVFLEEVVVTAQRREESLQDAPISIKAFSTAELETKAIFDLVDLHTHVPNFQIAPHPTSSSTVRTFMRGVGNNDDQITQDPSVAIYLDGAYIARSQGLAMEVAEIERIEVLRGPQGTLYGRNATGGAINFITRPPALDELGLKQSVSVGSRNLRRSNTRLNLPVVPGKLATQFSYLNSSQDGFIKNEGSGSSHYRNRDRNALRFDLLWRPIDDVEVRYAYDRSTIGDSPTLLALADPDEEPDRPSRGSEHEQLTDDDIKTEGHTLNATWFLSNALELKSVSTYRELVSDIDRNFMTDTTTPELPFATAVSEQNQYQFSQEFQFSGDVLNDALSYVAGLYYFQESAARDSTGTINIQHPLAGLIRVPQASSTTADNEAYAIFGQGTYTPGILENRLRLTLGGRWSRDKREATFQDLAAGDPRVRGSNSYSNFSPTLIVGYDVLDGINAYLKAARGYKSGGFNTRASSAERFAEGFDEEQLTSYEVGVKSQLLDNRLRVNAALFYADYEDIQINTSSDEADPTVTDVLNAGKAVIRGAELDVTALLGDRIVVNLSYGYLDPEFRELIGADGVDRRDEVTPINAPEHSYTVDVEYRLLQSQIGLLTANLGYTWQDEMNTSTSNPDFVIDDYGLVNMRVTLSDIPVAQGSLALSLWGKNLADKEYWVSLSKIADPYAIYGEPRTYGVDLSYDF